MKIEVSNGEIVDKWTIIQIKLSRIKDKAKIVNLKVEQAALEPAMAEIYNNAMEIHKAVDLAVKQERLYKINDELWEVEDILREHERCEFWNDGDEIEDFIDQARQVYHLNDQRARVKREINELTGSELIEEKSYEEY